MGTHTREIYYIDGAFPSPLYRGFEEKYAHLFLKRGSFVMRHLSYYQKIEDPQRKDRDEGEGRVKTSMYRPVLQLDQQPSESLSKTNEFGTVTRGVLSVNPRYIFCLSGPQVNVKYLADQYGGYVVCINQPDKLVRDIDSYLKQCSNMPNVMWLDCVQVRYDKDQTVSELPEPGSQESVRMSYAQKDPKFSSDCEYRLVLELPITGINPPTEIPIELRKRLEYAETVLKPTTKTNSE